MQNKKMNAEFHDSCIILAYHFKLLWKKKKGGYFVAMFYIHTLFILIIVTKKAYLKQLIKVFPGYLHMSFAYKKVGTLATKPCHSAA